MKENIKLIMLALWLALLSPFVLQGGVITHSVSYDPNELAVSLDTIDGVEYTRLLYGGECDALGEAGEPMLPHANIMLLVPYNATGITVSLTDTVCTGFTIQHSMLPIQPARAISDTTEWVFTLPTDSVYSINALWPSSPVEFTGNGYLFGDNHIINVSLPLVRVNSVTGQALMITSAKVRVSYVTSAAQQTQYISRHNADQLATEREMVQSLVANPGSVLAFAAPPAHRPYGAPASYINGGNALPTYNYCIITSRQFEHAFRKIVAMKRQKGYSAGVVCVEDIVNDPVFSQGDQSADTLGNPTVIADSAGMVRQYLKYAFSSANEPTQFVLMGGMKTDAPIRYCRSKVGEYKHAHMPTDMYFSDLTPNWKTNDSIYGKFTDMDSILDFYSCLPELFVGRLMCETQEDIENNTQKIKQYLFNPGDGNPNYLKEVCYIDGGGVGTGESWNVKLRGIFNLRKIVHNDLSLFPTGKQIIDSLRINRMGMVIFHSHGAAQSTDVLHIDEKTFKRFHQIIAVSEIETFGTNRLIEVGNALDCLSNMHYPMVCMSIGCNTMPFDNDDDFYTTTKGSNKTNFGQSFTNGKNYGGPIYIGNTRSGTLSSEQILAKIVDNVCKNKITQLGTAHALSKSNFVKIIHHKRSPITIMNSHIAFTMNMLGDPELSMWTDVPTTYDNLSVSHSSSGVTISGITANDTIGYCDNTGLHGRITDVTGSSVTISNPNSLVMIYRHNYIPYIAPLQISNCDIENSQYVYASTAMFGSGVTFKSGVAYEVEATGDVSLSGVTVENGAVLVIHTPGEVSFDNSNILSGAKVEIRAKNVLFGSKFDAKRGSVVDFLKFSEE